MRPTPFGDKEAQDDKSIITTNGNNALLNILSCPFMGFIIC